MATFENEVHGFGPRIDSTEPLGPLPLRSVNVQLVAHGLL